MILQGVIGSKNRVKILRQLFRRDGLSGRQLSRLTGLAPSAGKASLEELAAAGLVLTTPDGGRQVHELNRSHVLAGPLGRLFAEEARLPQRVADDVRCTLHSQPAAELLCLGIDAAGRVTLATSPCLPHGAPPLHLLARQLHSRYGLQLARCVASPSAIPASERAWTLPGPGAAPDRVDDPTRRRALRFFRIAPTVEPDSISTSTS